MRAAHLSLSTLTGSTLSLTTHITAPMAIYSTMMGSSITVSTMTGSTLFGSTMIMSSIRTSFLTLSTLTVSSINNNAPGTGTGSFSTLAVSSLNAVSSITVSSITVTTGNVGIGTTAPIGMLQLGHAVATGAGTSDGNIVIGKSNGANSMRYYKMGLDANYFFSIGDYGTSSSNTWVNTFNMSYAAPANSFIINSSGYVGIGTATPQASLHIYKAGGGVGNTLQGEIRVCSDDNQISRIGCYEEPNGTTWGGFFQYNGGGTDLIQIGGKSNGVDTYFMAIQRTTGNVGINTTVPITKFNVVGGESVFNGNVYLNSNANTVTPNPATYWGVGIKMAAEDNGWTGSDFNVYVSWQGGAWYKGFRFDNTGRAYNYNNSWGGLSDANMKENIINARNYLDDLRLLRVVKYSLKADQLTEPNQLGLIAQEVETIFPSLVSEDKDGLKYLKTSIIGMMQLKSIQELADKNDALEAKNAELTQKLDRLLAWAQTQGFSG